MHSLWIALLCVAIIDATVYSLKLHGPTAGKSIKRPLPPVSTAHRVVDSKPKPKHAERLQKVIANAGITSRREAERMILDGRVAVNGKRVSTLGAKMDPVRDTLSVDGKKVVSSKIQNAHWVVINKPKSVLTTMKDEKNRETVLSLVPSADELRLVPVGGMDRDDTGLLLLTNEVDWIHPLTHPSKPHIQRYEVAAAGIPTEQSLAAINEEDSQPSKESSGALRVELLDVDARQRLSRLSVTLDQRRAGQLEEVVRRVGCTLVSSKRVEYAGIRLRGLRRGQWRELGPGEVAALKASVGRQPSGRTSAAKTNSSPEQQRPPRGTPATATAGRNRPTGTRLLKKGRTVIRSRLKPTRNGAAAGQPRKTPPSR